MKITLFTGCHKTLVMRKGNNRRICRNHSDRKLLVVTLQRLNTFYLLIKLWPLQYRQIFWQFYRIGRELGNMKQINEYKNKNFELRENCILEKLTNFIFKSNKSLNRNPQKQQVSNKVFFITLIFVCLSPCLVDAYAGNDAVYTIPSQHKSKQVNKILIVAEVYCRPAQNILFLIHRNRRLRKDQ